MSCFVDWQVLLVAGFTNWHVVLVADLPILAKLCLLQVHKLEEIDSKLVASEKTRVQVFTTVIKIIINIIIKTRSSEMNVAPWLR